MKTNTVLPTYQELDTLTAVPRARSLSPLSWGYNMSKDALGYSRRLMEEYGDIVRVPFPLRPTYQVTDADLIGRILLGTEKTNAKSWVYDRLKILLGNGLITSKGDLWRKQRRLSNPAFLPKVAHSFVQMMQDETNKMADEWEKRLEKDPVIDISTEMMKLTYTIIVRALFSLDLSEKAGVIKGSLHEMQEYANHLFYSILPMPLFVPTRKNMRAKHALKRMDEVVYQVIHEHRKSPDRYQDLLSIYLNARDDETGESMSDQQLRDEVITLMLAGHDTTAFSLSMAFDLIAKHPAVLSKLQDEYASLQGSSLRAEDLRSLSYTGMVFSEVLRLFPATWVIPRELTEPLTYKNHVFPEKSNFMLFQYLTHRNPRYWAQPEAFIPERFDPENSTKHHPFAYFPFGGGQRSCVGSHFAKMEGHIILATLLQRFHIEPVLDQPYQIKARITLVLNPGVKVRLTKKA
ncbi:MAG: cytochrome P450 [Pseudobdellovibrionaceae bacterium]|nr:cytochrome P450 [Pseudobdellovibrionaceae bacterium]